MLVFAALGGGTTTVYNRAGLASLVLALPMPAVVLWVCERGQLQIPEATKWLHIYIYYIYVCNVGIVMNELIIDSKHNVLGRDETFHFVITPFLKHDGLSS